MAALHPASAHARSVPPDVLLPPEQHGHITAAVMRLQVLQPAVIKALGTSIQGLDALAARHGQRWALGLAEQAADFRDHACTLASLATVAARRAHFVAGTDLEETAMPAAQPAQPSTTALSALTVTGATAAAITMSTREIADLVDKRHDNVMRDARKMLAELHGKGGVLRFEDTLTDPQNGQTYPVLRLPKRETLVLISGYSVQLRARIIDRWQELEAQAARPVVPQTLPEALRLAADLAEQKAKTDAALALAAPKAAALDLISAGPEAITFTQAAKLLGIKRATLTAYMHAQGWIYRQNSSWLAKQPHIHNGRLLYKEAHFTDEKTGLQRTQPYCHILPKGLALLAQHFATKETV